jgi:predicted CoA-binding protein
VSEADQISELLKNAKTIAVVGLSENPMRAAYGVSAYMQSQGYRIIPVNPEADVVLGEKAYKSLNDIPDGVDIVDIFRRSEFVGPIVDEALQKGVKAIWMQETVVNEEAAQKARDKGVFVVMDRCILKEHHKRAA